MDDWDELRSLDVNTLYSIHRLLDHKANVSSQAVINAIRRLMDIHQALEAQQEKGLITYPEALSQLIIMQGAIVMEYK